MATVARESIGALHDKLVITLTKEDYYPHFEKALKRYGKSANIPGFRKGMVPTGMIRKMYGQSVFAEEVIQRANQELKTYMDEERPNIFAHPLYMEDQQVNLDMNKTEDVSLAYEIGLKPEFEIPLLNEKGRFTRYHIKIDDKMLQKETENLQRRTGALENPESPEELSDMVYSTYIPCDETGKETEGEEAIEDVVTLEKLPKAIADAVKGQKADFTYVFQPAKVCEEQDLEAFMTALKRDISEKDNYFKFTLTKVGRLAPSEINEDFFKKVFPNDTIENEEQFKAKLKEELEKEANQVTKNQLHNEIVESLVHETEMTLPEAYLKNWLKNGNEERKSEEEIEKEFPNFIHRLRWTLISEQLMRKYGVEVKEEDILNDLKGRVQTYFGMEGEGEDAPWLKDYLDKMLRDEKTYEETAQRLGFEMLLTKIAEDLSVKEETVDEETFAQLQPAHHHHHHE